MDTPRVVINMKPRNDAAMECTIIKPGVVRAITGRTYFSPARIMETAIQLDIDKEQIARLVGILMFETEGGYR